MKILFSTILIFFLDIYAGNAQTNASRLPDVDKSPMDMCYYPNNFPILKIQNKVTEPLIARVIYSRPAKNTRSIFGGLVEYGKVWRLGANEATEIEFFRDVMISGKKIQKGRYTLYAIVNPSVWTFILNKDTDTWGSFKYDEKKDVLRTDVAIQKTAEVVEDLAMLFEPEVVNGKGTKSFNLTIAWDTMKVVLPVTL